MKTKRSSDRHGLSMLEVIVSLTLVATIMLVSLTASARVVRGRTSAMNAVLGQRLAGRFLDEVSVLNFREPSDQAVFGPEPNESASDRASLDDVDDFHQFQQVTPTFRDGQRMVGFENWTVVINIDPLTGAAVDLQIAAGSLSEFRMVGVTVTSPTWQSQTFKTLVSNIPNGPQDTDSFERLRRLELRFAGDRKLQVVVPLRNGPLLHQ